ncbi:MAG: hypothetical protein FI707_17855 [SAR202 cluster bacterium]|jgi:hypothetical protein|nr:hypothetical protein [Chloroflexota bacterium]MQG57967.1 hypothetical protein [SAR202 cluster bacterium]MQG70632.1 hypothetical protein [SAR202 cluster bacterium]HAL48980.1 hypothetical protein [Dehalococcoidia bacterium]|tara:strand:- start:1640 stop:2062 length:423 start_codon:yes stop_codon:yes gene_type:complete
MTQEPYMTESSEATQITLERYDWSPDESDKDANFKHQVATYTLADPMPTIRRMSRNLGIPVGCIARYILVKWAASGSDALLLAGPVVVKQMAEVVDQAESVGTDEEKLAAYEKLSHIVSWLRVPLDDPEWRPGVSKKSDV